MNKQFSLGSLITPGPGAYDMHRTFDSMTNQTSVSQLSTMIVPKIEDQLEKKFTTNLLQVPTDLMISKEDVHSHH